MGTCNLGETVENMNYRVRGENMKFFVEVIKNF